MDTWTLTAKKDMRNYQWKALKFGLAQERNAMFLDMGLGKTTITLHTIKSLLHKQALGGLPVLVVAPIRVLHNVWRQEAAKWEHTRNLKFAVMHGGERKRIAAFNSDADIMLINPQNLLWLQKLLHANGYGTNTQDYDEALIAASNERILQWAPAKDPEAHRALRYNPAAWADLVANPTPARLKEIYVEPLPKLKTLPERPFPFSMLVLDESSMFKNAGTKRWNVVRDMAQLFKRVTLLTGTPTPNTMMELWPQMYFIDGGKRLGRSKTAFRDKYFYKADYMGYDWRLRNRVFVNGEPKTGEQAINEAVRDVAMRLDAKDWLDVPEILSNIVEVEMPEEVQAQYKEFEDKMFLELLTSDVETISAASLSQKCHQFANGAIYSTDRETETRTWETVHDAKLEALEEVLSEAGGNAIVAYQFKHDLARLRKQYPNAPVLGGGGTAAKDAVIIEAWNKKEIPVLLAHPASAGHGLNLQHGGHVVVFFSLTWSLEQHDQLIARLHRSGQTERVVVHYLRTKDTVDELIYTALLSKARSQKELLDALREYSLKREELKPKEAA